MTTRFRWTLLISGLVLLPSTGSAVTAQWEIVRPVPAKRISPVVVYDNLHDRMLISGFNGISGIEAWDGHESWWFMLRKPGWRPLTPPPSGLSTGTGAYIHDPLSNRVWMFGGDNGTDRTSMVTLPDGVWTELNPPGFVPWGRHATTGVYDAARHRMVIYGGIGANIFGDVAAYGLNPSPIWRSISTTGPPAPRYLHAAIYDASRDRMVVFGGSDATQDLNEVWSLDFGSLVWTLENANGPALRGAAAVYDPHRDQMVILGGETSAGPSFDVWALSLSDWTWTSLPSPGTSTHGWRGSAAIYDPRFQQVVTFGWFQGDDVWALDLENPSGWTRLHAGSPGFQLGHSAVRVGRDMVIFGDFEGGDVNTTWAYDLDLADWTLLEPSGIAPPRRTLHSAVFDTPNNRMVVYGGGPPSDLLDDLWALTFTNPPTWNELNDSGDGPGLRSGHAAIYDPVGERMVVFGGSTTDTCVYTLNLGGTPVWTKHTLPSGPDPRDVSAVYDPPRERMLAFTRAGVWSLSLTPSMTWTQIVPTEAQPPWSAFSGREQPVYDAAQDRVVMFNGGEIHAYNDDTYVLTLAGTPAWTGLAQTGDRPPEMVAGAAIYDPVHDRMILHNGAHVTGTGWVTRYPFLWHLNLADPVDVAPRGAPVSGGVSMVRPNPGIGTQAFRIDLSTPIEQGKLEVFSVSGRRMWSTVLVDLAAGRHWVDWDGRGPAGRLAAPGVYLVSFKHTGARSTRRFVRIR